MNDKKIAFIICTNNNLYYEECVRYINELIIPTGYLIDIIAIKDADNILCGYNAGMASCDAKYKVYLHQDTFILYQNFLKDTINIFENNSTIGMIGVLGTTKLPENANCYLSWNIGKVAAYDGISLNSTDFLYQTNALPYISVEAIDGMLMMTQYDLPWREDILSGWDFYDISQSLEMRYNGYTVVVPYQETEWCYHDNGVANLSNYDIERQKIINAYPSIFNISVDASQQNELQSKLTLWHNIYQDLINLFNKKEYSELVKAISNLRDKEILHTHIRELINLMDIYVLEHTNHTPHSIYFSGTPWEQIYDLYLYTHFIVIRLGYQKSDDRYNDFFQLLINQKLSVIAVHFIAMHSLKDGSNTLQYLLDWNSNDL